MAEPGIDGHEIGVKVVGPSLSDVRMEVIYTGRRTTASATARMAIQEDMDVIGISNLSGPHILVMTELHQRLKEAGATDTLLLAGGSVLRADIAALYECGVTGRVPTGAPTDHIVRFTRERVRGEETNCGPSSATTATSPDTAWPADRSRT